MAVDNVKYRFIQNIGDYFPAGYFNEDFIDKVQKASGLNSDDMDALCKPFVALKGEYEKYKNYILNTNPRVKDAIRHTHDFHTHLLKILGYNIEEVYAQFYSVDDDKNSVVPVRHVLTQNGKTTMLIMEMQNLIKTGEKEPAGLYSQRYDEEHHGMVSEQNVRHQMYYAGQWSEVFTLPEEQHISPAVINQALDALFLLPEERRPHFILMMAGNTVFLMDSEKWNQGAYLEFSLDELFSQASISTFRKYYALFHLLTCKETLASDSESILMDTLVEESYKNAYEVAKDLKEGVVKAVETLANEALYYKNQVVRQPFGKLKAETGEYDETDDDFENEVKDDCLTLVYRLLFIFYAESRTELEILPTGDNLYKQGYSLEMLRDLEQVQLRSKESEDGYFFDESIQILFRMLSSGYNHTNSVQYDKSFKIRPIDSPLFANKNLKHMGDVKIRNCKWKEIICSLSLSKKKGRYGRGRISYANLGVNQLGSVYESLLAFRGFYAEEDYIEVHKAGKPEEGTFLVPYRRMDDFAANEVLCGEDGCPLILSKGSFVYRLNGRDRQKSASYYTPEVLTQSTVKYTLKSIIDEVAAGKRKATELLELKILEPAMGAAAFQNEVINQLAKAYLTYQQQQQHEAGLRNWRIKPDKYRDELQKVKAYIATHNVYGVDLNPTAIELGKLSLWLNVIHKDMETPFFANRLTVGNAVIGAWLKVYNKEEFLAIIDKQRTKSKPQQNKWWEKSPHKIKFYANRVNRSVNDIYHFLLPDANMLAVRGIKEQKAGNKAAFDRMTTILKDWTAPILEADFHTLQRISAKIDVLLKDYFTNQLSIDKCTNNRKEVWDGIDHTDQDLFREEMQAASYAKKQELFDTRYGHNNAYHKLKLVMDYWCALWFWEYKDADTLPTRSEFWADIEALLNVDESEIDSRTKQALRRAGMTPLFDNDEEFNRISEDESEIITQTSNEILRKARAGMTLFEDEEPYRFSIVKRLSDRYRFFHPMLEFIEVFWLRDGFDIICGNPPWIKLEFNEKNVISDLYPEVVIHNVLTPDVRKREDFMDNEAMKNLYMEEQNEHACSTTFLNAVCNYPLLIGQQTNLYKCVLTNSMDMMSPLGFAGILCPDGIYNDAKGQPLRKELYKRLRYHFGYQNKFKLFADPGSDLFFGCQIIAKVSKNISFESINDVFTPTTIDACFAHDGSGDFKGLKDENGKWSATAHRERIVHYSNDDIATLSNVFEDGTTIDCAKLISINLQSIMSVLKVIEKYTSHIRDKQHITTECFHETGAPKAGIIVRETAYPSLESYGMIYNAPHFFVGNPYYKTPTKICETKFDYDDIDLSKLSMDYMPRSNYKPLLSSKLVKESIRGFSNGKDDIGKLTYDSFLDYYKVSFRRRVNLKSERSLICAVLPRKTAHIHAVISTAFRSGYDCVDMAALCSSIILDFFIKIIGASDIYPNRIDSFPLGVLPKYQSALYSRTLLLNCLTVHYADLWESCWREEYAREQWSITDDRLNPFNNLTCKWGWQTPLRNYFERRQALVEIDVLVAMTLGLSLKDLELIYRIQFPVLQQNEADTWYDTKGNIVFTCSRGLTGVGVDRSVWERICNMQAGKTYEHTIEKSELYQGQHITYYAPFTKCDRVEDYRRAWVHFEKRFNNKEYHEER